ncbi:MAG TPA: sigma 54-interacting transcriptional regulator [Bryobacteraceae bacterium]|nr:sigma 54-interacting transcriptional regulator [Bryobacteraceae bacterium]
MPAVLIGTSGPLCGHTIPLDNEETTLGRSTDCAVSIPDRSVSREHCIIRRVEGGGFEIHDLDSYNGTFANGLRVCDHLLSDGDEIVVGEIAFVFRSSSGPQPSAVIHDSIGEWQSLTLSAPALPRAREVGAVLRVGDVARTVQELYLHEGGEDRGELEKRLFGTVCELIPSAGAAIFLLQGEDPVPFAGYSGAPGHDSVAAPESALREVVRSCAINVGSAEGSTFLAAPITVPGRVVGVLYLDSGGGRRDYLQADMQMVTALGEMLGLAIENARDLKSLRVENVQLRAENSAERLMVGNSPPMKELFESIAKVARGQSTVLIRGESGTGKELVARAIHRNSPRAARPFVAVNCAAITETLLESEFFGHEKGAFTGAYAQRKGKLEQADTGTVFLDEIGELSPTLQAKLLRVLQEHEFERVGGTRAVPVDIRVIAATNRDLERAIEEGAFRKDLFYRVNVVPLRIPPLRQRREDIPLLANWFLRKFTEQTGRRVTGLSREARALLTAYDWPGNVRELQNVIERAVVMGTSEVVTPDDLCDLLPDAGSLPADEEDGFHAAVRQHRRRLIASALEQAGGNIPKAARLLKLHPNYLHRLITTLGLRDAES